MSKINIRDFFNENEDGAPDLVVITTFSATSYFVPTRGTTLERPVDHVEVGSLRYNYDTKNLEYYRGKVKGWYEFELIDPDLGGGVAGSVTLGTRALFFAGLGPDYKNEISHITISTLGNDQDFGDSTASKQAAGGFSSRTRGFSVGGMNNSSQFIDVIEFATFASLGDATDFGNLTGTKNRPSGVSYQTRGVSGGGIQIQMLLIILLCHQREMQKILVI